MTTNLITKEQYENLVDIQQKYPALTFQHAGYQTLDMSKLTEEDIKAFKEVEDFLRENITGFVSFTNFCLNTKGEARIRFQYNWTADAEEPKDISFTGVGYLRIIELYKGFYYKE